MCRPGVVLHTYRPSNWEAKEGEQGVQGQPGLLNESLSQQTKKDACTS
jgi:hypothetical protein